MTWLFFVIYYPIVLFVLLPRIRNARDRQRLLTWPHAKALLADPKAVLSKGDTIDEHHLQQPYTYYVKGQAFTGQQIEPGFERQHTHYKNMMRFYLMRREPRVYFNPNDPEEAYLQPGKDALSWSNLVWGGVVGVIVPALVLLL